MLYIKKITVVIFIFWLVSGIVGLMVGIDLEEFSKRERRLPVAIGNIQNSKSWPLYAEKFFEDRIFLRNLYISSYQFLEVENLIAAFNSNSIFFTGKKGWLFLGNRSQLANDYLNENIPNAKYIDYKITQLKKFQTFALENGAAYAMIIAPNKRTIYADYLPSWLKRSSNITLADIIHEKAKSHNLHFVFPKQSILNERNKADKLGKRLYWKDDSHWNGYGAFIAFKDTWHILKSQKQWEDLPSLMVQYEVTKSYDGDIIVLANLSSQYRDSVSYQYKFQANMTTGYKKKGHLLSISDSYTDHLLHLYHLCFDKVTVIQHNKLKFKEFQELITTLKPDAVIYEMAEQVFPQKDFSSELF